MTGDLPDYSRKVIVVYEGTIVGGEVLCDHRKILGVALKSPTFAQCIPSSIENDAIAYDSVNNRFYVDLAKISATDILAVSATNLDIRDLTATDIVTVKSITDALPSGSNAIGKLAANDGVNIGHVDVVTMPDVTQATAANLKATVTQAEKDRTMSDITKTTTIVSVQATASGNTTIQTPAAGKKIRVKLIDVWNSNTAAITVYLRFAAAGTARFKKTLAANTGFIINLIGTNWEGAADEALIINLSAIGIVDVTVMKDEV